MRTIAAPLATEIASREKCLPYGLLLVLRDGTRLRMSTLDVPITADLGDGDESYSDGMTLSAVTIAAGLDSGSYEVSGPIGSLVTRAAVLGGRFNRARASLFRASPNAAGIAAVMGGNITEPRAEGGRFFFEIRSHEDRLNQTIGRTITPYCDADFGDARCGFVVVPVAATVTAVTGALGFTVSFSGSYASDYFNQGTVTFLTGALAGTAPVEMFDWTSGGVVTMFVPLAEAPVIGDTLELRQGCPKTRAACRDLFSNVVNFRGFPEVPGSDQVLKYAVPGSGGA